VTPTPQERWSDLARPPLTPAAVRAVLEGSDLWRRVDVVATTGSTNADLAARAVAGLPDTGSGAEAEAEGIVLVADHQSAGRGRLDRQWTAPPRSSLAVSVLLAPRGVDPARWSWLPLLGGLAMAEMLQRVAGLEVRLKWPNDVLVVARPGAHETVERHPPEQNRPEQNRPEQNRPEQKVCGLLTELVATPDGPSAVLGAGLNVSQDADELPVPSATSLRLAGAATLDRGVLLRAYLRALEVRYLRWCTAGGDPRASGVAAAYREACATIGRRVRVQLPAGQACAGTAEGVDDDGHLLVREDSGRTRALAAGDVVHVR
jgi:BirA family transcriptional regulator, biotin operon repressor / biotin---[acetyl-CoA-carboxylase] ligase